MSERWDRAILYSLGFRALGVVAGPVTVVMIAACFSPALQGYFYTFLSILRMQVLVELGLGTALQQLASHEWSGLHLDGRGEVAGDEASRHRLALIARFAARWYAAAAALAVLGFGAGGSIFFSVTAAAGGVVWESAWVALSILAGLNLFVSPAFAILEGCNEVRPVYGFRLAQGISLRAGLWLAMSLGAGLWALVVERLVTLLSSACFLGLRYAALIRGLLSGGRQGGAFWREEIWPLQWRFAVVWVAGFLPTLFVPALFALEGPVAAGRIGMTWAIAAALLSVSYAFLPPRVPQMAIHVARGELVALDRLFARAMRSCVAAFLAGGALFLLGLWLLEQLYPPLASRFLPLAPTVLLLAGVLAQLVRAGMGIYLRTHKREPYLVLSVVEALVTLGLLFPLGARFGGLGICAGYCAASVAFFLPALAIFRRCKRRWLGGAQSPEVSGR